MDRLTKPFFKAFIVCTTNLFLITLQGFYIVYMYVLMIYIISGYWPKFTKFVLSEGWIDKELQDIPGIGKKYGKNLRLHLKDYCSVRFISSFNNRSILYVIVLSMRGFPISLLLSEL